MKFGTLTAPDAKERTVVNTLKKNQVMLQWRLRDAGPTESKRWKNHGPIDRENAKKRVEDYNDYSTQFDYRIRPEKTVDTNVSEAKVAA